MVTSVSATQKPREKEPIFVLFVFLGESDKISKLETPPAKATLHQPKKFWLVKLLCCLVFISSSCVVTELHPSHSLLSFTQDRRKRKELSVLPIICTHPFSRALLLQQHSNRFYHDDDHGSNVFIAWPTASPSSSISSQCCHFHGGCNGFGSKLINDSQKIKVLWYCRGRE